MEIKGIKKEYGHVQVLNIDYLRLDSGLLVIYGKNGSGKSTLLRILSGVEAADSGIVKIDGDVAYMPQDPMLYEEYRVSDYISLVKEMRGDWSSLSRILDRLSIKKNQRAGDLSYGTKKALHLAVTLSLNSKIFLLDEPFMGMDLEKRDFFIPIILKKSEKKAIILTESEAIIKPTHILEGGKILEAHA